jgi:integrase
MRHYHTAATKAVEVMGGDVAAVQAFMGHANPATTMIYVDAVRDRAGDVARRIQE